MEKYILEYFKKRNKQQIETAKHAKSLGPVLTISRECGCDGTSLAQQLAARLNEYYLPIGAQFNWKVISKEILENAAKELETHADNIKFVFQSEQRSLVDDFMQSVTVKDYQSEWKIKKTIKNVIRDFASDGYSIILGRGGAQITRDINNALHIKLVAPLNWRIERFMLKHDISKAAAIKKVKEIDSNREKLIQMLYIGCSQEMCYDVTFNLERFPQSQLVSDIIHLMQQRKLI
jgi:cytidylate kinase